MIKHQRRILLLTDVFPCDKYSGALMSAQLCRFLLSEKHQLFCACVKGAKIEDQTDDYLITKIPCLTFKKPDEKNPDKTSYDQEIEAIAKTIVDYITEHQIDTVWCPIQGESLLKIYHLVQVHTKKLRFIAQIWDPFKWILHDLGYNKETQEPLLKLFDKVLKNSTSALTASRPMAKLYSEKYQIPCYPIFTSYNLPSRRSFKSKKDSFVITISGQTYALKGIDALLQSLDRLDWKYHNKKIRIRYFGPNPQPFKNYTEHVTLEGFVSQNDLVKAQNESDLLYCSYYFNDKELDIVRQQSYPSKIITYIPSQVPILIHSENDSPVYQDFKKYQCGYLLSNTEIKDVTDKLIEIFSASDRAKNQLIDNSFKLFKNNFTYEQNQKSFFKAFDIQKSKVSRYKVLEVNNVDTLGHFWNGYDIAEYINNNTNHHAVQVCIDKYSQNHNVVKLYSNQSMRDLEYNVLNYEANELSVHSCLSVSSPTLENTLVYKNSDLIHFHLIHNMKLSLFSLIKFCNDKPAVISVHDPWTFTGHCVHYYECQGWKTGCKNCPHLDYLFPLKHDKSHDLWKLKQFVYQNIDADFVVSTKYMYDLFKSSPLTKDKRVHLIPFGIDIDKFSSVSKKKSLKELNIPENHIVLFHRAQTEFKGTDYLVDALKQLNVKRPVTIITCGELNLLNSIKDKYNLIELGTVDDDKLALAYNACDIFVMPSTGESFGMMAVEAMSCGKPVICFDNTALPSVTFAPDCGIAVENLNSTALMKAIKRLITDDEERLRRGKLAKKIVAENYDAKKYYQKMDNLYQEVLARKRKINAPPTTYDENDQNVINLKAKLNKLTRSIFPKGCIWYEHMIFRIDHKTSKEIDFGNVNVQILLDEYNHKLRKEYEDFIIADYHDPRFYKKIIKYSKITTNLIIHDRKKMIMLIKKRIRKIIK